MGGASDRGQASSNHVPLGARKEGPLPHPFRGGRPERLPNPLVRVVPPNIRYCMRSVILQTFVLERVSSESVGDKSLGGARHPVAAVPADEFRRSALFRPCMHKALHAVDCLADTRFGTRFFCELAEHRFGGTARDPFSC